MKIKFSYIMLLLSLSVAGCAAYFSVWGLSQLFAGASTAVIIMASILEIGKVVTTTALHRYWSKLARGLKIYLTISVGVLMMITSAGIYGFLSNAYQKTSNKLEIHEGELGILDGKKAIFEKSIADNQKIIDSKTKRIDQLTNLRGNQEARLDGSNSNRSRNSVRSDIQNANTEIQSLTKDIDELNAKNGVLSDSIGVYDVKSLELKSSSDIAGEVGPLKYISELTGAPMANVVNYLILLLIFVFDPLAIALILITNRVFQIEGQNNPLEPNKDETKEVLEDAVKVLKKESYADSIKKVIQEKMKRKKVEKIEDNDQDFEEASLIDFENYIKKEDSDAVSDAVSEAVSDVTLERVEQIAQAEKPKEKIQLEDIKEIKEGRGFSVPVPDAKTTNTIERIGSNKVVKNGDNNKVYFKRG
jgi:hypothetical protein